MNTKAITKLFKKSERIYLKPLVVNDVPVVGITNGVILLLADKETLPAEFDTALLAFKDGAQRYSHDDKWSATTIDIERILPKNKATEVAIEITQNLKQHFGLKRDTLARVLEVKRGDETLTIHVNEALLAGFNEAVDHGTFHLTAEPGNDGEFKGAINVYSGDRLVGLIMPLRK